MLQAKTGAQHKEACPVGLLGYMYIHYVYIIYVYIYMLIYSNQFVFLGCCDFTCLVGMSYGFFVLSITWRMYWRTGWRFPQKRSRSSTVWSVLFRAPPLHFVAIPDKKRCGKERGNLATPLSTDFRQSIDSYLSFVHILCVWHCLWLLNTITFNWRPVIFSYAIR